MGHDHDCKLENDDILIENTINWDFIWNFNYVYILKENYGVTVIYFYVESCLQQNLISINILPFEMQIICTFQFNDATTARLSGIKLHKVILTIDMSD